MDSLHFSISLFPFGLMKLNFLWSLLYNCLSIPIAAGAFYPFFRTRLPPTVAAIAMALSSISVVVSSFSLRLYRPPSLATRSRTWSSRPTRRIPRRSRDHEEELREPLLHDEDPTEQTSNNASEMEEGTARIVAV